MGIARSYLPRAVWTLTAGPTWPAFLF